MNRTYTYAELKERIQKDYETFNFIIESKHIFNQEFIGFRKFFKNLLKKQSKKKNEWFRKDQPESEINKKFDILYPYFEKVGGYRIYLNKETVADLSMKQLYKDFPNLKADYDLLLSLKEKVRSGKRPKDLEKDYEAERLKKAAEENKATCGICHQHWELVDMQGEGQKFGLSKNVIADHGFTIKFGNGRNGVCFGARFHCWEKSPKVKIEYVKQVLKPILAKVIKAKPTNKDVNYIQLSFVNYKIRIEKYNQLDYTERCKTKRPKRPEYRLPGQQIGTIISKEEIITLEYLTKIWSDYKTHLENEIARFETAIKNWNIQPTPRERLKENQ